MNLLTSTALGGGVSLEGTVTTENEFLTKSRAGAALFKMKPNTPEQKFQRDNGVTP